MVKSYYTKRLTYKCSKPSCNNRISVNEKDGFIFDKSLGGRLLKKCLKHRNLSIKELLK